MACIVSQKGIDLMLLWPFFSGKQNDSLAVGLVMLFIVAAILAAFYGWVQYHTAPASSQRKWSEVELNERIDQRIDDRLKALPAEKSPCKEISK
jgi:hypothetical protein